MSVALVSCGMLDAYPGDGTGSNNGPPQFEWLVSSGTPPTNGPKVMVPSWRFDAIAREVLVWKFRASSYASGGTLKIQVAPVALQSGTNTMIFGVALAAITPGASEKWSTKVFPTFDTLTITLANNEAAEDVVEGSINLSATALDGVADGDDVALFLASAVGTATLDRRLLEAEFRYTTT